MIERTMASYNMSKEKDSWLHGEITWKYSRCEAVSSGSDIGKAQNLLKSTFLNSDRCFYPELRNCIDDYICLHLFVYMILFEPDFLWSKGLTCTQYRSHFAISKIQLLYINPKIPWSTIRSARTHTVIKQLWCFRDTWAWKQIQITLLGVINVFQLAQDVEKLL
jgi:hypothetical protein